MCCHITPANETVLSGRTGRAKNLSCALFQGAAGSEGTPGETGDVVSDRRPITVKPFGINR